MFNIKIDIYAWIPQPDVPNPIYSLPGGVSQWGAGACGPRFGGDNMTDPPASPAGWSNKTYRAMQSFGFSFEDFGSRPTITSNPGTQTGMTTVLSAPRSAGGAVCHSLKATVLSSSSSVEWSEGDGWYQASLAGKAQDPVPAEVGRKTLGGVGGWGASQATPALEWMAALRFSRANTFGLTTRSLYAIGLGQSTAVGLGLDESKRAFGARDSFGSPLHLMHGFIRIRRFPSYVLYVTVMTPRYNATIPVYYANASKRGLLEIAIDQLDILREITF